MLELLHDFYYLKKKSIWGGQNCLDTRSVDKGRGIIIRIY